MGPLAGVGDPVFWFTMRPILAAVGASLALSQNILGPIFLLCGMERTSLWLSLDHTRAWL